MDDQMLMGLWRCVLPIPSKIWRGIVKGDADLGFMEADHHRVRNLVVEAIPREAKPLTPEWISHELDLPLSRVVEILDELERNMTFLFRNPQGAVTWAYPVTVDKTPHRVTFSTGEKIYAAGAFDAIAVPFVQGQLRNENLSFTVATECGHCGEPLHLEIDSQLNYRVLEEGASPHIYAPMIDVAKLDDPSIIDGFGQKSIFFWSEEHAKAYRRKTGGERGIYASLDQSVHITRVMQSALFGFAR